MPNLSSTIGEGTGVTGFPRGTRMWRNASSCREVIRMCRSTVSQTRHQVEFEAKLIESRCAARQAKNYIPCSAGAWCVPTGAFLLRQKRVWDVLGALLRRGEGIPATLVS